MSDDIEAEKISFTASLITQGKYKFYSLTIPSDVLSECCFVIKRDEDPKEGFQRLLNKERAKQIADYIDSGFGSIPTAVILSAQDEAQFEYNSKTKTISFRQTPKSFLILDGQHRVYGFSMSKTQLRVPVIIYSGLNRQEETRLFIDINVTQKAVPNELLLDIRKLADYQNDIETRLGDIYDMFHQNSDSPLLGLMSPSARARNKISRVTFNASVKPLLGLFGDFENDQVYSVISSYIVAVLDCSNKYSLDINVVQPNVFKGLLAAFPLFALRVKDRHEGNYNTDNFIDVLSDVFSRVRKTSLQSAAASGPKAYLKVFEDAMKTKFTL